MKIIRLPNGTWEWRVRIRGFIGQANGFAPTREKALRYCILFIGMAENLT